jgi:hypothetical protein
VHASGLGKIVRAARPRSLPFRRGGNAATRAMLCRCEDDEPQVKVAAVVAARLKTVLVPTAIVSEAVGHACLSAPACLRPQLLQPGERPAYGELVRRGWRPPVRSCLGCRADPRRLSDV